MLAMGIQIRFLDLLGYGCWCSFLIRHDLRYAVHTLRTFFLWDSNLANLVFRPRNKEPSDKIDEICRKWSKCHECSSIDSYYQCSAQGHDIYQVQGIIATGKFTCASEYRRIYSIFKIQMIFTELIVGNEDSCALRSCECDTELVYKVTFFNWAWTLF